QRTAAAFGSADPSGVPGANGVLLGARPIPERHRWLPVGQTFALSASHNERSAFAVRHLAGVVAERELVAVAGQMATADMVERSDDAALQQTKEPFNGVRVNDA